MQGAGHGALRRRVTEAGGTGTHPQVWSTGLGASRGWRGRGRGPGKAAPATDRVLCVSGGSSARSSTGVSTPGRCRPLRGGLGPRPPLPSPCWATALAGVRCRSVRGDGLGVGEGRRWGRGAGAALSRSWGGGVVGRPCRRGPRRSSAPGAGRRRSAKPLARPKPELTGGPELVSWPEPLPRPGPGVHSPQPVAGGRR